MICRRAKTVYLNFRTYSNKSRVRHNFHKECEEAICKQINAELQASHDYIALAWIFKHDSVSLPGFYQMFQCMSKEEMDHAWTFVEYQILRGGSLTFAPIREPPPPICQQNGNNLTPAASAVEQAFDMELGVTKLIENLHSLASKHGDTHLCDFLDGNFIDEQYKDLKYLGDLRTQIELVKDGSGLFHLDLKLGEKYSKLLNK